MVTFFILILTFTLCQPVLTRRFLDDSSSSELEKLHSTVQAAVQMALQCDQKSNRMLDHSKMRSVILPMWEALPKNRQGSINQWSLRHAVHRYFLAAQGVSVRSFQRLKFVESRFNAETLNKGKQSLVGTILESKHLEHVGFSLEDIVSVATLFSQITTQTDSELLDTVLKEENIILSEVDTLSRQQLARLISSFMIDWMLGEWPLSTKNFKKDKTALEAIFPIWDEVEAFAEGCIKAFEFSRWQAPRLVKSGISLLTSRFSYDEVLQVITSITTSFHSFWRSEWAVMKDALTKEDPRGIGRVPISKFYNSDAERFAESESYLRELGALDETSQRGKQVIISNYLQAASNCIVGQPHYLVCAPNECDVVMNAVEKEVGTARLSPTKIMDVVGNMTKFDNTDEPPVLGDALVKQLDQMASLHDGEVPLHGRLFAQWLHYVFPRECAFPHKIGATNVTRPLEFTENFLISDEDLRKHVEADDSTADLPALAAVTDDFEWMSQWSDDEEFLAGQLPSIQAPWEGGSKTRVVLAAVFAVVAVGGVLVGSGQTGDCSFQMSKLKI